MTDMLAIASIGALLCVWWFLFERKPKVPPTELNGEIKYMAMATRRAK